MSKPQLPKFGKFENDVIATWLLEADKPDRIMQLAGPFAYIDPANTRWDAPTGSKIDGASIPEFFWGSIFGSPYTGDFRRASVVHDVACDKQAKPWQDVHKMFFYAMRCDDTAPWLANAMFAAVWLFGPRWGQKQQPLSQTNRNIRAFHGLTSNQEFISEQPLASLLKHVQGLETSLRKSASRRSVR